MVEIKRRTRESNKKKIKGDASQFQVNRSPLCVLQNKALFCLRNVESNSFSPLHHGDPPLSAAAINIVIK